MSGLDYLAMMREPWTGKTLDQKFVYVMDFYENGRIERERYTEAKRAIEEARAAEYRKAVERMKHAVRRADSNWKLIKTAPLDGTPIIGLAWDGEIGNIAIAQVYYRDGRWRLSDTHYGYDLDGDELQPSHWMAI